MYFLESHAKLSRKKRCVTTQVLSSFVFLVSSVMSDVVLRIRIFRSHTHQDPVHLQIFYKGMLNYLAQETVDQILPRLDDLLQINGEKTFFIDLVIL